VNVSAEDAALLALAGGQPSALDTPSEAIRWDHFLERVTEHCVWPLVRQNAARLGVDLPSSTQRTLDGLCAATALKNRLFAEELVAALEQLEQAGIPVVPLKGVALAESLFGDPALRASEDIDVLVPRAKVPAVVRRLSESGYRTLFDDHPFFADVFLDTRIEYALQSPHAWTPHYLEVHWALLYGAPFDGNAAQDLWTEVRPSIFRGVPCYALSPEWELLFLAGHASRHQWYGLKWLVDLDAACRRPLDWHHVRNLAEKYRWTGWLRITATIIQRLFGTPMPDGLLLDRLPRWVHVFPDASPPQPWRNFYFPVHLLERPSDKVRFVARVLLTPGDGERRIVQLHGWLSLLYYPIRILRIAIVWSWRLLAGRPRGQEN
jgi:hypothetical protein